MAHAFPVTGKGLGLRRALMRPLEDPSIDLPDFLEVAPENWIDMGGALGRRFRRFTERVPFVCHGLSLNLGGSAPLDEPFVRRVGQFLDDHGIRCYSEHLSYCADDGQLYDLMPIPFTEESVRHVAARIRRVQDLLGRRLAIENVSYYCAPGARMTELEFLSAVLDEADCEFLLDVNNVYVNSVNHGYDARAFLEALPGARIAYVHVAGHEHRAPDLIVDTHGAAVVDPVWELLGVAYARFGVLPTLLERDFDLPPLSALLAELAHVGALQAAAAGATRATRIRHG
jgi:uncharacterized protein (UPF0276 family)